MPTALTIAGSDSGGGAGIQADLKTFAAHGVYGVCAVTSVTAQNTTGVIAAQAVTSELVRKQIEAVMSDFEPHAAKTGMLPNAAIVLVVARAVVDARIPNVVIDPVMLAKSGDRLVDEEAIDAVRNELLRHATVVTPNVPEAEALTGSRITDVASARVAARRLHAMGAAQVVIKGGHLPSPDILDLLFDGQRFLEFRNERVPGRGTHGTGCTFAATLAAQLALGRSLTEAIPVAQRYVAGAIRHAPSLGRGHGPMHHFWMSSPRPDRA